MVTNIVHSAIDSSFTAKSIPEYLNDLVATMPELMTFLSLT